MPKRELSKCREWERERRERLKTCFEALGRLLPSHDPTIVPSKLEILQRAAAHITDLQQKNKELLLGDQPANIVQRDEIRRLRERVRRLNCKNEHLVGLLRKDCQGGGFKPPRKWSGRLTRDKAESLRKEEESKVKRKKRQKKAAPPAENAKKPRKKCRKVSASLVSKVATVLGPGTLILANGNVVPVPAPGPTGTLHRVQIVNQRPLIVMTNPQSTNKLPVLRPKTNLKPPCIVAKVPIPSLNKKKTVPKKSAPKKTCVATDAPKTASVVKTAKIDEKTEEKLADKPENTKADEEVQELNVAAVPEEIPPEKPPEPEIPPPAQPEKNDLVQPEEHSHSHSHSELSNDIFASLGAGVSSGAIGGQHTDSMSPTAAFLLAFPLVSTLTGTGSTRISDPQSSKRNEEDRQSTPTTLLQIGSLDSKNNHSEPIPMTVQKKKNDNFGYFPNCLYEPYGGEQNSCNYTTKENVKPSSKARLRPPVNWMTAPDPPQVPASSDYFLPPFSDVYSGVNTAISSESEQNFTWGSGGNRGTLPTLLGDLALGGGPTNVPKSGSNHNNYYNPFDQPKEPFLSVSSLVGGKPPKRAPTNQPQNHPKRHRDKTKPRGMEPNVKYGGGYSAEELIGPSASTIGPSAYIPNFGVEQNQPQRQQQRQNYPQQQQQPQQQAPAPFGAGAYPQHGEFSALLSAAVVDSYSGFGHVKTANTTPGSGYESYKAVPGGPHHRRQNRQRGPPRDGGPPPPPPNVTTNTPGGFSELSFLSMSAGAVSSPILQDDFHGSAPFLNAPPPIPTPVTSSLTNFNLSAIFPEINKGAVAPLPAAAPMWPHNKPPISSTRQTRYQNNHEHVHQHRELPEGGKPSGGYCHPQQGQQIPHDGIFGTAGSFLTHHQMQTTDVTSAPTNFSFSFAP